MSQAEALEVQLCAAKAEDTRRMEELRAAGKEVRDLRMQLDDVWAQLDKERSVSEQAESALRNVEAERLALLNKLHASEAACSEHIHNAQISRASAATAEAELQALLDDAEARVQAAESATAISAEAAKVASGALEAAETKVTLVFWWARQGHPVSMTLTFFYMFGKDLSCCYHLRPGTLRWSSGLQLLRPCGRGSSLRNLTRSF
jgi:hypothetical protein